MHTTGVATEGVKSKKINTQGRRFLLKAAGFAFLVVASQLALLTGIALLWKASGTERSVGILTRDLAAIAQVHPLTGALSQLGAMLWAAAAAVCGLAALQHFRAKSSRHVLGFFVFSSVLSLTLLIDDLFMVHDYFAQIYLGVPDQLVIGLMCVAVLAYLLMYRKLILSRRSLPVLMTVCALFGIMLTVDYFQADFAARGYSKDLRYLLEDGTKFLGICGWLIWLTCCSLELGPEKPGSA